MPLRALSGLALLFALNVSAAGADFRSTSEAAVLYDAPSVKGKPLFVTAVAYACIMYAAMWYFQSALFILWGSLSATGG